MTATARLLRRTLADPRHAVLAARLLLRARLDLRACAHVGAGARLQGRCVVRGGEGIRVGDHLTMLSDVMSCELSTHDGGRLEIGDRVFVNQGAAICAHRSVRIGSDCKIGHYALVLDCDFHELDHPTHDGGHGRPGPIVLEDGVWLGARVTVLKGVTIGRSSVIAAGSVVTHDVPPGVLAGGTPAEVLRPLRLGG
jgi:acetyltransferase-like isoleucine patch superfamily enzyme